VCAQDLGGGRYEVGVHIADVSHFVPQGSKLDDVAQQRSTSVYLVHRVIPMLPSILCENLCSLNRGVDRFAFSVIWVVDDEVGSPGCRAALKRCIRCVRGVCMRWYAGAKHVVSVLLSTCTACADHSSVGWRNVR
jgi:hypothetical protein